MTILVLGTDPGLANFGWAIVEVTGLDKAVVVEMGVFQTEKSDKKRNVKQSDDNAHRARLLTRSLDPLFARVQAVTNEGMSFAPNAANMAKLARAHGVKDALVEIYEHPHVEASPQEIKNATAGGKDASKRDVQDHLDWRFGYCLGEKHLPGIPRGSWEHPYDAVGSVVACLDSDVIRACLKAT